MRWSLRLGVAGLGLLPLAVATSVLADGGGPNPKLKISQGTYYVTQINAGAVARVVVGSDGSVHLDDKWISGLPSGGPDSAVFVSDGTMITSNFAAGTISRVDVNTRKILQLQVNKKEYNGAVADLAADPKSNSVYYILRGDSDVHAVGKLDLGSGNSQDLNPSGVESVGGIAVSDDGSRLFVSSGAGYVSELNPSNGHELRRAKVPGSPDGMSWDPSNGKLYASSCGGICELKTGGDAGSQLTFVKVYTAADGDGIAADGQGHVYVAESDCGSLCRLDLATNTAVTVEDSIEGADDVTPVAGAGSVGGACLAVVNCLGGAGGAGLAAAGIGLLAFMGAAGFTAMRPASVHVSVAHAHGAPAHGTAAVAAHGAPAGGAEHTGLGPPGHEGATPEVGHLQEEAGDKLLEIGGAGVEAGAGGAAAEEISAAPPSLEPAPPPVPQPPEPGLPGATRAGRDEDEDGDGAPGAPAPPPV